MRGRGLELLHHVQLRVLEVTIRFRRCATSSTIEDERLGVGDVPSAIRCWLRLSRSRTGSSSFSALACSRSRSETAVSAPTRSEPAARRSVLQPGDLGVLGQRAAAVRELGERGVDPLQVEQALLVPLVGSDRSPS